MQKSRVQSVLFLTVLSLIWGSSFILMKIGLHGFSAVQVASLRVCIAGLVFLPYIIKNFKNIPWSKFRYIFIFALFEIGIPPYLYTFSQSHIDSSSAGILNSLVPLFTLLMGMIIFKLRFHFLTITGVLIGLLGAFVITFMKSGSTSFDFTNAWGLLIVIATLLYGIAGNVMNEHLSEESSLMVTAVSFVSMAIPASLVLMFTDIYNFSFSNSVQLKSMLAIITLAVFGSALAIALFSKLIKLSNALFASFITYFIPFVSFLWGWLDNEDISAVHFLSIGFIFLGIYFTHLGERRREGKKA